MQAIDDHRNEHAPIQFSGCYSVDNQPSASVKNVFYPGYEVERQLYKQAHDVRQKSLRILGSRFCSEEKRLRVGNFDSCVE